MTPEEYRASEGADTPAEYIPASRGPAWPVILLWALIIGCWGAGIAVGVYW